MGAEAIAAPAVLLRSEVSVPRDPPVLEVLSLRHPGLGEVRIAGVVARPQGSDIGPLTPLNHLHAKQCSDSNRGVTPWNSRFNSAPGDGARAIVAPRAGGRPWNG